MTNEEKSIAIVTLCPSVYVRPRGQSGWNYRSSVAGRVLPCIDGDPLKDLNAMHEAEMTLDDAQFDRYVYLLTKLFGRTVRATAAQRADAFLLTHGLTP